MHSDPPYVGGDPEMQYLEVNPGVEESRFNLWRDLKAMYTRCAAVDDHHEINKYFLFERLQACTGTNPSVQGGSPGSFVVPPGHECTPKKDICLRYDVSTSLLSDELRHLEQVGKEVILPVGAQWGPAPENEGRWE